MAEIDVGPGFGRLSSAPVDAEPVSSPADDRHLKTSPEAIRVDRWVLIVEAAMAIPG